MPPTESQLEELREAFERYRQLPRHKADSDFSQRLTNLQTWETESIRKRHAGRCAEDPDYARVIDYYLEQLHNGLPLDGMVEHGPQGLERARRMDKAFPLFASAIQYSVLCAILQDRLVETLGDAPLTATSHAQAIKRCDDGPQRIQRLDLLIEIGQLTAPHLHSRMVYTGFKLLKGLFRTVGMADIHGSMDQGFKQLRGVSRLAQSLAQFAHTEQQQLQAGPEAA